VLLPALLDASLEQTAASLGVGRATVGRYQAKVRRRLSHPGEVEPQWASRRRASTGWEEELEFLRHWAEHSAEGGMLFVGPLRAALAQRLGHPVAHSAVYRLLARHGWRKVAPGIRHPRGTRQSRSAGRELPRLLAAICCKKSRRAPEIGRRLRVHRLFAEVWARTSRRGPSA
jgi:transposase